MCLTKLLLSALLVAAPAAAQVVLAGDVYDGHGGPLISGVVYRSSGFTVPSGQHLGAQQGAILKFDAGQLVVNGAFEVLDREPPVPGPIVLTSIHDDSVGGDTNRNGSATLPAPGQWGGLVANSGSFVRLQHCELRNYGSAGEAGLEVMADDLQLAIATTTFASGAGHGVDFHGHHVVDTGLGGCTIKDNAGIAFANLDINDVGLGKISYNSVAGNGGNFMDVTSLDVSEWNVQWFGSMLNGGVLVLEDTCHVLPGSILTFGTGVVKFRRGGVVADGAVKLTGGSGGPCVLTSFADDAWGGDTNGDGAATLPAPGDWAGVQLAGGIKPLDRILIRYAGSDGTPALQVHQTVTRSRVEHCAADGLVLAGDSQASFDDLVAWDCGGTGIEITGPASLRRCTAVGCATGIAAGPAFVGQVRSSIAWGNGAAWSGLDLRVSYSDGPGFVGGAGNVAIDPQFIDAAAGNLRLQSFSPCIDAGDPLDQPGDLKPFDQPGDLDALGFLRLVDGNLDTIRRVDIGAYEFDNIELALGGTWGGGGTLEITSTCNTTFSNVFLLVGALHWENEIVLPHYGTLWIGLVGPNVMVAWPTTSGTVKVTLPSYVYDYGVTMQLAGRAQSIPGSVGNLSNPVDIMTQ